MSSERPTFAAAVTCIDGRVHEPVAAWVKARFGVDHVDLVTQPGPDLALCCETEARIEHLRESLGVSAEAHRSGALVIAGHADCAANPVSEAQHRDHLRRALSRALTWAPPDMVVVGVWVDDEGRVTEVDASPVPGERVSGPGSEPIGRLAQAMDTPSQRADRESRRAAGTRLIAGQPIVSQELMAEDTA